MGKKRNSEPQLPPMQEVYKDKEGHQRFRENAVVRYMYDWCEQHGLTMNQLIQLPVPDHDLQQFAQLIGYSLCGYSELSYVDDTAWERVEKIQEEQKLDPNL